MAFELVMPKLGLTMKEGLIVKWIKNEGDAIKVGDEILEIQTEKLTNIIESPFEGTILKIVGQVGDSIPIADILAYIGEPGEAIPDSPKAESPSPSAQDSAKEVASNSPSQASCDEPGTGRIKASPAARALAKKLGIDYKLLIGTGPGGRIVKADVISANENGMPASTTTVAKAALNASTYPAQTTIPLAGMRKAISDGMSASWAVAPMVTHHADVDVTELLALREQLNKNLEEGDVKIGVLDLFCKIVIRAMKDFPIVNSTISGNNILVHGGVNLGIATAIDGGLVVPVVMNADQKDLFAISCEIKELAGKARSGALSMDEMQNGTFTISSIGGYNSVDHFTPIINQPESAILGICRTKETPVVKDGEIVIRSITGLSFTFDHRVIDGAPAAEFMNAIQKYLDSPARAIFS